jgi:hypothetical protein
MLGHDNERKDRPTADGGTVAMKAPGTANRIDPDQFASGKTR